MVKPAKQQQFVMDNGTVSSGTPRSRLSVHLLTVFGITPGPIAPFRTSSRQTEASLEVVQCHGTGGISFELGEALLYDLLYFRRGGPQVLLDRKSVV